MKYPQSYCVFDFETTGLDPLESKITEIGALKVTEGQDSEKFNVLINWGIDIPQNITEITGITTQMCKDMGLAPDVAQEQFMSFIKGSLPLVGHNIFNFDLKFLALFFKLDDIAKAKLNNHFIDTAAEYKGRKLGEERKWNESFLDFTKRVMERKAYNIKFSLSAACDEFGIDRSKVVQHRALADVELTNQLYRCLFLNESPTVVKDNER